MLDTAQAHYGRQARITALGTAAARRALTASPARVFAVVTAAQLAAIAEAEAATDLMLAEQGIQPGSDWTVNAPLIAGIASDGRNLATLLEVADSIAQFVRIVETQIEDAGRAGAAAALAGRPQATGYVRMVEPGACSRCIILAGRWYRWSEGFDRHPQCKCRHIPSRENVAGDVRTDPRAMFDGMPVEEQDRVFGKAGAEAIRLGADMNQVVNARRGIEKAQVGGREVLTTREGMTRLGEASKRMGASQFGRKRGHRYLFAKDRVRLMPETILDLADDREHAVEMLRTFGYLT